jgi:ATP-dependent Lhr-like helicase
VRATPITLLARRSVKAWSSFTTAPPAVQLSSRARAVMDHLETHGASFFDEITESVRLLPVEAEEALGELVALGLVNSDSFAGLRALLVPSAQRGRASGRHGRRKRRIALFAMADAGRWAPVRRAEATPGARPDEAAVEHVVRGLLRRWGVIFWKLLVREADWLPPWREIVMCCRRLEARGEIRGGRFIAGFSGEQYATSEAIPLLREVRRRPPANQYVSISAADPLNLAGILTPGARLPSLTANRLLYADGVPIAQRIAGEVQFLEVLEPKQQREAHYALLRRHLPAELEEIEDTE